MIYPFKYFDKRTLSYKTEENHIMRFFTYYKFCTYYKVLHVLYDFLRTTSFVRNIYFYMKPTIKYKTIWFSTIFVKLYTLLHLEYEDNINYMLYD